MILPGRDPGNTSELVRFYAAVLKRLAREQSDPQARTATWGRDRIPEFSCGLILLIVAAPEAIAKALLDPDRQDRRYSGTLARFARNERTREWR